jgi:lipoyl(octanoyl) transferase
VSTTKRAFLVDLGRMSYSPAAALQRQLLDCVAAGKCRNTLLFVEHEPVLTLGANFHPENLLMSPTQYEEAGIEVLPTERGGDVTYHGPGQLVIYPIFNVTEFGKDLHKWLRDLEETIIRAIAGFHLSGSRLPNVNTGVWVNDKKLAAIGIKVRKWVSMHGIALNCDNDLRPFELIVPCGIKSYGVTSLSQELQRPTTVQDAKPMVKQAFEDVFQLEFEQLTPPELVQRMR